MLNPGSVALGTKILRSVSRLTMGHLAIYPQIWKLFHLIRSARQRHIRWDEKDSFQNILKQHLELSVTLLKRLPQMLQEPFTSVNSERNVRDHFRSNVGADEVL